MAEEEIKCSRCKHKLPKNVCGSSESPHYNQKIELTDSCDHFLANPAQDNYINGLKLAFSDAHSDAVMYLEKAIKMGLPHDDEMEARFILGTSYVGLVNLELPTDEFVASSEFSESIAQMERAVVIDREGEYGYFLEPFNRARLVQIDKGYSLVGRSIQAKEGDNAAIAYLEQKLQVFDYLKSNPMLNTLLGLGVIYAELGDKGHARECFKKIIEADPVDPEDERETEAETRKMAEDNLKLLESRDDKGKSFKGSKKVIIVLGALSAMGLIFLASGEIGTGLFNFLFWGAIAFVYWKRKCR